MTSARFWKLHRLSYLIELTTAGALSIPPSARADNGGIAFAMMPQRPRATRTASNGPVYVYRCSVCGKKFNRKTMDGSLNEHKNPQGYPCYGRYGIYERTKY